MIPQRVFRFFCCRMYSIWERLKLCRRPLEEFLRFDCVRGICAENREKDAVRLLLFEVLS